ncbi:hypothetical protein [Lichenifustis flavocetrariae]|uniref:hypothetical protein n=1 Tax=Lichenifustis flavocetrariae TaxID=2949735 RepID=UPI0031F5B70A
MNEFPEAIEEDDPPGLKPLPKPDPVPHGEIALLLHLDDLRPESLPLGDARIVRVGGLLAHAPDAVAHVRHADEQAMADALERAGVHFGCDAGPATEGWAGDLSIVTPWAPVGPSASALSSNCLRVRRRWDDLTWPRATRGYFQVKAAIPTILRDTLGH